MSDIDDHNNSNPHSPASEMSQTLSAHSAEIQWGHPDDQVVAAWWLFVNENWVPRTTEMQQEEQATEYEYVQRRRLIKEWVEKAQDERDAYAERASALSEDEVSRLCDISTSSQAGSPHSLPLFPLILTSPAHASSIAWPKLLFLTRYDLSGTCWDECAEQYIPSTPITPTTFATTYLVEQIADFGLVGWDITGGAVVYKVLYQFADEHALRTGERLLVEYDSSGGLARSVRIPAGGRAAWERARVVGLGHGFRDIVEESVWEEDVCYNGEVAGGDEQWRVDMDMGVVEVVMRALEAQEVEDVSVESVREDVRRYAPELL